MRILKRSASPNTRGSQRSPGPGSPVGPDACPPSPTSPRLSMGGRNSAFKALHPLPKPDAPYTDAAALKNYFGSDQFKFASLLAKPYIPNPEVNSVHDSDEEINVNDESDEEKERQYIEMLKKEREKILGKAQGQPLELTTRDRDRLN